ncbi:hypothetical protein HQQ81_00375 [Microbacteriaceae bacterium VKM Ac-2854]|nr:hypothetical protein [Microbacteriaceae bacterium VKM Ac-2854]
MQLGDTVLYVPMGYDHRDFADDVAHHGPRRIRLYGGGQIAAVADDAFEAFHP